MEKFFMNDDSRKLYLIWFQKALDDLSWTQSNLNEHVWYGACFTAQQSVEKALKAYLLFKHGRFDKIHDLVTLLGACAKFEESLYSFKEQAAKLSFYYIKSRYPDMTEIDVFSEEDAHSAYRMAQEIITVVQDKIGENNNT